MAQDLAKMSRKQLEKLRKDVEKALAAIERKELREARKAAEKAVAKFGFKLNQVASERGSGASKGAKSKSAKKSRTVGVAKFANPDNPSQTWTGKGRQPNWYKAATDAGKDPSSMAI